MEHGTRITVSYPNIDRFTRNITGKKILKYKNTMAFMYISNTLQFIYLAATRNTEENRKYYGICGMPNKAFIDFPHSFPHSNLAPISDLIFTIFVPVGESVV